MSTVHNVMQNQGLMSLH